MYVRQKSINKTFQRNIVQDSVVKPSYRLKKFVDQADEEDVFETLKDNEDVFHVLETFPGKFKGEVRLKRVNESNLIM